MPEVIDAEGVEQTAGKTWAEQLGSYYKHLLYGNIPQDLADKILLDAAQRLHTGEIHV